MYPKAFNKNYIFKIKHFFLLCLQFVWDFMEKKRQFTPASVCKKAPSENSRELLKLLFGSPVCRPRFNSIFAAAKSAPNVGIHHLKFSGVFLFSISFSWTFFPYTSSLHPLFDFFSTQKNARPCVYVCESSIIYPIFHFPRKYRTCTWIRAHSADVLLHSTRAGDTRISEIVGRYQSLSLARSLLIYFKLFRDGKYVNILNSKFELRGRRSCNRIPGSSNWIRWCGKCFGYVL